MSSQDDHSIRNIVIVGGGSAGWITAGLIAAKTAAQHSDTPFNITLIESPHVGTVGVGEGTWPTMRSTLRQLGITESTFLNECSAGFKQGTRFIGWVDGGQQDLYYHPFTAPTGYPGMELASCWQYGRKKLSFTDAVSPQGMVCDRNLGPKQAETPEYAGVLNYAYHLDAGKFATLLAGHCMRKLGVHHILDHITGINSAENGDIASLETTAHGAIAGDLFIDCSGMRSMLLGDHFGVPFIDKSDILFNDTALAIQVPYSDASAPIASQTISTARPAGWIWDIGLTARRGVGYVYSSRHGGDHQAQVVLEEYLQATSVSPGAIGSAQKISFSPGYRAHFWHRNCVAVGMSAGFIEPLEASALVMVELSARMIAEELPTNRHIMDIVCRRFNERFGYRWDRIIDFLKLHYVLSRRDDTEYWRDNRSRASVPNRLLDSIELWRSRPPIEADFPQIDEIFSAASYQYVLYGMSPDWTQAPFQPSEAQRIRARQLFQNNVRTANQCLARLPTHRKLLEQITRHGLPVAG